MRLPRRRFLRNSALLTAASLCAPSIIRAQSLGSEKLRIAIIGAGGRGKAHVSGLQGEEIVAFCDIDDKRAAETFRKYPKVPRFKDYRVMFDKMGKQFDAVSIAIPDHMHYPVALWALAHGKHLLVEKPLVRTFEEALLIKQVSKEAGVITQMGNQGHASDGLRVIQEWLAADLIGEVQEAYHWTNRPIWPQGMADYNPVSAVPDGIDWNLWQGVAPQLPYREGIAPRNWRGYRDYGCGAIGDIACHSMDASYTSLNLGFPVSVSANSTGMTAVAFPSRSSIDFKFLTPDQRPIMVHWLDGGRMPSNVPYVPDEAYLGDGVDKKPVANGTFLVGTKGTIMCDMYCGKPMLFPEDYFTQLRADRALPAKSRTRLKGGHFIEWVDCVKAGKQPGSNIAEYAADFTATALLGTVALMSDSTLDFNASTKSFVGNPQANALLKSQYDYRTEFLPS
ncbi:MAG: Gfo/Idh/MocA family oxidoreductase [Lentimonas sp.]